MIVINKRYSVFSIIYLISVGIGVYFKYTNQYVFMLWLLSITFLLKAFGFKVIKKQLSQFIWIFFKKSFLIVLTLFWGFRIYFLSYADILKSHGDEAIFSFVAYRNILNFFNTGYLNMLGEETGPVSNFPALWYCIQGAFEHLLGYNIFSAKIWGILTDFIILLTLWFYGLKIRKSVNFAFVLTFLYSCFFPAIFFSNVILNNLQSSLFFLLTLVFFLLAKKYKKIYVLVGVLTGWSLYFYLSSISLPIFVFASLCYVCFLNKSFVNNKLKIKNCLQKSCYFLIGYIFSSLPFWVYSFAHYNFLQGRLGGVNVINGYTENFYLFFKSQFILMINGFYKLPFNGSGLHYVNLSLFNSDFLFYLFLFGGLLSIIKYKKQELFPFFIFFVLNFILGGLLTNNPPAGQRLLPFIWISCVFITEATIFIYDIVNKYIKKYSQLSLIVILVIFFNINLNTFKLGFDLSKNSQDPVLGILPYYDNTKLPIYGVVPPHTPYVLSLYLKNPDLKVIDILREPAIYNNDNQEHYLLIYSDARNLVKVDDIKYKKLGLLLPNSKIENNHYDFYKTNLSRKTF